MDKEFKVGDLVRVVNIQEFCEFEDDLYYAIDNAIGMGGGMWDGDHAGVETTIRTIEKTGYRYPDGGIVYRIKLEKVESDAALSHWVWCDVFLEHVDTGFWKVNVFDESEKICKKDFKPKDVVVSVNDVQLESTGIVGHPTWGSVGMSRHDRAERAIQDVISRRAVHDTLLDFDELFSF